MNESSNGNIREHLTTHEDVNELLRIFEERKEKQTFSAHILAHLNPRNAYAKYTDHGSVKEIFDFFAQYLSGNDLTAIKTDYVKYKKQKGDFSTPTLWEKGIVDDQELFWAVINDFNPVLTNFAKKLLNTPPNSVLSERAFSVLKLQYTSLRNRLSLTKLDYLYFLFMNRRVLDRKATGYKRTIYDLTPTEKLAEKNEILNQKTIIERGGTSENEKKITEKTITSQRNGNTIKRRRLNANDVEELKDQLYLRDHYCMGIRAQSDLADAAVKCAPEGLIQALTNTRFQRSRALDSSAFKHLF